MPPRRKDRTISPVRMTSSSESAEKIPTLGLDVFAAVASTATPIPTPAYYTDVAAEDGSDEEDLERRQVHNMCERNRRMQIREGFYTLQRKLPNTVGMRMSKMDTLKAAVEHIKALRGSIADLEAELNLLRRLKSQKNLSNPP